LKLLDKLDALQDMARACAEDRYRLYTIGLLAEHVEEVEVTGELLGRVEEMLISHQSVTATENNKQTANEKTAIPYR